MEKANKSAETKKDKNNAVFEVDIDKAYRRLYNKAATAVVTINIPAASREELNGSGGAFITRA